MLPSPGGAPSPPTPSRRDRTIVAAALVVVTATAWAYLVHLDRQMTAASAESVMMAEMGMAMDSPWSATDLAFTFAMWAVMMVGMMAASAAPVLGLFGAASRSRGGDRPWLGTVAFALGYLLVWLGFSAGATMVQWALHRGLLLTPAMTTSSAGLGGAILVVAGVYQLTPWKGACLTQCRSPLGFLMTHWHDGRLGAVRMGIGHGSYCLGCCWAVMCVLFVVGVMNLWWVAVLTSLVLLEKIGPAGAVVARAAGAVMIAGGLFLAAGVG